MKSQATIPAIIALVLIGAVMILLLQAKSTHQLGGPGVKTRPLPGSANLEILLPEEVPGYTSRAEPEADIVIQRLPKDTSYGQRVYRSSTDTNFIVNANVVLMGTDRSSIHKPQICLTGQGWDCDQQATREEVIPMERPFRYDLPVNKYVATKQFTIDGQTRTARGLYIYWYVDATHYTAKQWQWMSVWVPQDLVLHGRLERWAYISYFAACAPGQEEATFNRMKQLIALTVPEFQLVPRPPGTAPTAPTASR